jgi:iron complex outermembrane recepter protein
MCRRPSLVSLALVALCFTCCISTSMASSETRSRFDLPAEPLDKSLRDFAVQANCNISYEPSLVAGQQAPAIKGEFTPADALSMILAGTRLVAVNIDEDTIEVVERTASTTRAPASGKSARARNADVARVDYAGPERAIPNGNSSDTDPSNSTPAGKRRESGELDEIIVTGTHIRGTKDSPSPVQVFTRDDIDATGATTVQQFLQTLPENFGGGASENTIGGVTGNGQTNNSVSGSAPNLRGLGPDATLVLINGHRVAPGNTDGSFVDVSMIPLTAIERIEVVTDGASAIYGSEAVGGVVNIILRTKFVGAESRLQWGTVSSGSMHNVQAGQTVGDAWDGGSALVSYQYFDQTPLSAGSRDYLKTVKLPFTLLPEQVQHGAFANIDQKIGSGLDLHGDLAYSHRSTYIAYTAGDPVDGYAKSAVPSQIDGYSASVGSMLELPRETTFAVTATYSESDTSQQYYQQLLQAPVASPLVNVLKTKSAIASLDATVDGLLAKVPAGPIRYAVGAQFRDESFGSTYFVPATDNFFYPSRRVRAAYGELRVPLVGPAATRGDPALEITLADRAEKYSDFGSTNDPQAGAIWKPFEGISVRGTYGKSFKAPLLSQLNPVPSQVAIAPTSLFVPAPGGTVNTLVVFGGNPALKPQKATVWTAGLDLAPPQVAGLTVKLTYYDIVFRDQIATAEAASCWCNAFVDTAIFGPPILNRNPTGAQIQQLLAEPSFTNIFNVDPATIGAIFDGRYLNLSTVKTNGLDFRVGYKGQIAESRFDTGVDGTYIFTFDNQFTATAPVQSILNTIFNPSALRLRGRVLWTRGGLTTGVYLNFVNAYTNNEVKPYEHVASWTTADAIASYEFAAAEGARSGLSLSLSVVNLAGRDPPYALNPNTGNNVNYDGANANALGRYFSLRLGKRW